MTIWVDADACPRAVREILFRAAARTSTEVILVANQPIPVPRSPLIRSRQVPTGFDVADDHIVAEVEATDLVITSDIPLAAAALDKGATVISPRGEVLDRNNIGKRLAVRNLMDELRGSGVVTGGPPPQKPADRQAFANALDRWLARRPRR